MIIDVLPQVLVIALIMAITYMLISIGLSVIFSVLGVVNFAHGEFYMLGAFGAYVLFKTVGAGYLWWLPLVILSGCVVGAAAEKGVFSPLRRDQLGGLIASFGIGFILQEVACAIWGPEDKTMPSVVSGTFQVGSTFLPREKLLLSIIGAIFVVFVLFVIHRSKIGRAIRAVAQDSDSATLCGINVNRTRMTTLMLGSALAVSSGFVLASLSSINPYMGGDYILKAFMVIIIGGLGSIYGAIVGSLFLALIDAFGMVLVGVWSTLAGFVMLALVLLFRPYGLMGIVEREETK
jgi:branched-chain amino acid transport system permease protein